MFYHHVTFNSEYLLHQRYHFSGFYFLISLLVTCFASFLTWIYGYSKTALVISFNKHYYFCLRVMYWCHFVIPYCKSLLSLRTFKFHTHHVCYTHEFSFPFIFLKTVSNFHLFGDTHKSQTFRKFGQCHPLNKSAWLSSRNSRKHHLQFAWAL